MSVQEMLNHVRLLMETSLGERTLRDVSNPLSRLGIVQNLMLLMPWPKGKIKAPIKLLDDEVGSFAEERAKLVAVIQRFAAAVAQEPGRLVASPLMGPVTLAFWSRLHGKHVDHHLRQFGV